MKLLSRILYHDGSARVLRALPAAVVLVAAVLVAAHSLPGETSLARKPEASVATSLQESFSFDIKDLAVRHQGQNTLQLSVHYTYKTDLRNDEYPDFRQLAAVCEDYFVNDRDESNYWEIVNKDLTAQLLDKFPVLADVQVEIRVAPTTRIPWTRASTAKRSRTPEP